MAKGIKIAGVGAHTAILVRKCIIICLCESSGEILVQNGIKIASLGAQARILMHKGTNLSAWGLYGAGVI